jgi:hypothetical protein
MKDLTQQAVETIANNGDKNVVPQRSVPRLGDCIVQLCSRTQPGDIGHRTWLNYFLFIKENTGLIDHVNIG